ncbi:carotenoid biosynthesis protein [Mucilaginibacter sp. RS28]|uniref:Carotenoid biosynthesis protein n=1 Tax=Mucilaginibacter straminoryzae TaxID=2932774 RepID=A0A9X1X2H5_9SPHI|nr:carotenoid biosynthesis protein [Mucilaginibacter straminoryzae]MCJ8208780.1 carotenoid biosynthesis protein [Mucilaginibacter straminoryzae]
MERQAGLNVRVAAGIIVLFHLVGLVGLMVPRFQGSFLQLVPFHLLLMFVVVILSHRPIDAKIIGFAAIAFLLGFAAEWIGVHKAWIFGNYAYGKTLGTKVFDIPLTIGLNWFVLVYAAGVSMQYLGLQNAWLRILAGSVLLVLLDVLIEPVAIYFDYWQWTYHHVPFKNYVGWFAMSALLLWIFERFKFEKQSWAAPLLLAVQFIFFGLLANTDIAM